MKFIVACIVSFISLSAFAASPATDAAGRCSAQLMNDLIDINSVGKSFIKKMTDEFVDLIKREAPQAEVNARMGILFKEFQGRLNTFRATYGDFECEIGSSGQKLNSVEMYQSLDQMNAALLKMAEPPVAKDGECGPEIKADYLAMTEQMKPLAKAMVDVVPELTRKSANGEDFSAESALIRAAAMASLGMVKSFRAKHTGVFSCSLVSANGEPLVLESTDIDVQIDALSKNIQGLN